MLDKKVLEKTITEVIRRQGHSLNGKELLDIRTGIALSLEAKQRHRQRMTSPPYQWKKPAPRR